MRAKALRQFVKIANHVYASRMGNGDEASGDGWNFRGRGAGVDTITAVTKVINGGVNGLQGRIKALNKYYQLLQTPQQPPAKR